jgi:tetratricopeptide (TPR) repeat protein
MSDAAPRPPIGEPLVDADHPWLGLLPFRENHRRFFFGRGREVADLFERVCRHPLTVLFGPSGLGKTSLLYAGLCPRLREAGRLPVLVRLRYPDREGESTLAQTPSLLDQIAAEIFRALEAGGHAVPAAIYRRGLTSLWPLVHDTVDGLCRKGSPRIVLLFDQFEEVFTLGEDESRARDDAARLRDALADLVENRPPPALARQLEFEPELAERFDFGDAGCHVAIVLREDFLARLERWRRALPSLMRNRMELCLLDGPRAFEAVVYPARLDGRDLVSDEVGAAIVRAVAGAGDDVPLNEIGAVPPLLSLLCARLNELRPGPRIEADLLAASREDILQSFYSNCFSGLPEGTREAIEDLLLSPTGFRESPSADTVRAELLRRGVAEPITALRKLEDSRLVAAEERGGIRRIELTHDVLAPLVRASRDDRRAREDLERLEREEIEARNIAAVRQERIERTERLIDYLLNSLPKQVPPTALGDLFTEVDRYYSSLGADERDAKEALSNRAILAFHIGTDRKKHEDAEGALRCFQEAASLWDRLGEFGKKSQAEREISEVQKLRSRSRKSDADVLAGTYDIFVSYSRRDDRDGIITTLFRELQQIHRRVTGTELTLFFDNDAIASQDDWHHRRRHALAQSRLFAACLSPNYLESSYCRREWETFPTREMQSSLIGEGMVPILCRDVPELSGSVSDNQASPMVTEFRRRQFIDLRLLFHEGVSALGHEDIQRSLHSLVRQIVSVRDRVAAATLSPSTIPPINRRFVGRRAETAELCRLLESSRNSSIVAIHGLGGAGKTELAFAYAHVFAARYPGGRYLVLCNNQRSLRQAVATALDGVFHDDISDEQRKSKELHFGAVRDALRRRAEAVGDVLLILDNIDDYTILNRPEIDACVFSEKVHLLATTRSAPSGVGAVNNSIAWLALGELPTEDAVELLRNYRAFDSNEDGVAAEEIVRRLGGFALAVELVAAFLSQNSSVSYAAMLERLQTEGSNALDLLGEDGGVQLRRHTEHRVGAVLAPTLATLSTLEEAALEYASLFGHDQVALPWLRALCELRYEDLRRPPPPGHPDPWQQAVNKLLSLNLLSPSTGEGGDPRIVRCHRLVQEVVGSGIADEAALRRDLGELAERRAAEIEKATNWQEAVWELPVLEALAQKWAAEGREIAAYLLNEVGSHWSDLAEWGRAEPLLRQALEIAESRLGPMAPQVGVCLNSLATLLLATNRLTEAEPLLRRAPAIDETLLGSEHPNVVTSLSNLASLLEAEGKNAEAEAMMRRALVMTEETFGPKHPYLAKCLNNLATLLRTTNRFAEAEALTRRALAIMERCFGSEHPNVATGLNNLADVLFATGRYVEAEPPYRRALAINERSYGPDHPSVAAGLSNLGQLLCATNRLAEAEPLFRRALAISEQFYGQEHSNTGILFNNLATLRRAMNG